MKIANEEIRKAVKGAGLLMWMVADELGIADHVLSRKLRYELSDKEKQTIYKIIDKLSKEAV